jgi:hypothetical protein
MDGEPSTEVTEGAPIPVTFGEFFLWVHGCGFTNWKELEPTSCTSVCPHPGSPWRKALYMDDTVVTVDLNTILEGVKTHHRQFPGCGEACHHMGDFIGAIRRVVRQVNPKSEPEWLEMDLRINYVLQQAGRIGW